MAAQSRRERVEMRLADWARMEGIPLRTAQRMHSRGTLPVPVYVTSTNRIMVIVEVATPKELVDENRALKAQVAELQRRLAER